MPRVLCSRELQFVWQLLNELCIRACMVYDYKIPVKQREPVKPTQSVVEVHQLQPCDLAAPDHSPEEVANSLHIPGAV